MPTPPADIEIDPPLVRRLLAAQHPDLVSLPLRLVANGWDNAVFRLGDDLAVRVPRRESAAHLVRHEQEVLPAIAARVPVAVPVPVRIGVPGQGFAFHWSVVRWFAGGVVAEADLREDLELASTLAAFLRALHVPAPEGAPVNPVRGVPLQARAEDVARRLLTGAVPHAAELGAVWSEALATPRWAGRRVWLHGDLHPANLVERDGRLAAVIDFGDVTGGDPATDLATAWLTFGPAARAAFRNALGYSDADWARARGWALVMATAMVTVAGAGSVIDRIGTAALEQLLLER